VEEWIKVASEICEREQRRAQKIQSGGKLREQLQLDQHLTKHSADATYTFRQHLRPNRVAIEE